MTTPAITVLGAGVMGDLHANVIATHRSATLQTVVDVDIDRAQSVAEAYGAIGETDTDAALERADACIIATPEPTHANLLERAVKAGCAVLLEKPIASNPTDADRIGTTAAETTLPIVPGHLLRFDPRYAEAKAAVENGEIGDLISLSARRAIPRAWSERMGDRIHPVKQIGTHDVDLLRWIAPSSVTRVQAVATEREFTDIGIPDAIHATISFESGATATARFIGLWPEGFPADIDARMELVGSSGGSIVQIPAGSAQIAMETTEYPDTAYWPQVHGHVTGTLRSQLDHFLNCLTGADPQITMADAVRAFEITEAIVIAIDADDPVDVPPSGE